jgi:hypothetical protein
MATSMHTPAPTRDCPETGIIGFGSLELSRVLYWREGSEHNFRSIEFDIWAADADKQMAITKFVDTAEDYATYLNEIIDARDATDDEVERAMVLLKRLTRVYQAEIEALNAEVPRIVRLNIFRKPRRVAMRGGYRPSSRKSLSQLQSV